MKQFCVVDDSDDDGIDDNYENDSDNFDKSSSTSGVSSSDSEEKDELELYSRVSESDEDLELPADCSSESESDDLDLDDTAVQATAHVTKPSQVMEPYHLIRKIPGFQKQPTGYRIWGDNIGKLV